MKIFVAIATFVLLAACGTHTDESGPAHDHDHEAQEIERGPHNGRLLKHEDFAVELAVFETGVPPEFRVWLFEKQKPLAPGAATVTVTLRRLDGETNHFTFRPEGDYLRGSGVVAEPHSFDVVVAAQRGAERMRWTFDSYEGRTTIAPATAEAMGVRTAVAGPVKMSEQLTLSGTVTADPARVAQVRARYAGVIREVRVEPGAHVRKGDTLAQVQSNESLQNYALTAPIAGTLVEHAAQTGVATTDAPLFTIMDTSRVWVELEVFASDLGRVKQGQRVELQDLDGRAVGGGRIDRVAPLAIHGSQSVRARVVAENKDGLLRPGQFLSGLVVVNEFDVPLAIEREALQRFRDFDVVFERIGDTYEVRMLELGRMDARFIEVTGGLKPGAQYVSANSYLIKADIEKSGASHDH